MSYIRDMSDSGAGYQRDEGRFMAFALLHRVTTAPNPDVNRRPLSNLTTVTLVGHANVDCLEGCLDLRLLSFVFRLPSVKEVYAESCSGAVAENNGWGCSGSASNVTRLTLTDCNFDEQDISDMIRSCKGLREFECQRQCSNCFTTVMTYTTYPVLRSALLVHHSTIERLSMNFATCGHYEAPANYLDSLEQLRHLTDLELNACAFDEWDNFDPDMDLVAALPPNLKVMAVHCDNEDNVLDILPAVEPVLQKQLVLERLEFCGPELLSEADIGQIRSLCPGIAVKQYTDLVGTNHIVCGRVQSHSTVVPVDGAGQRQPAGE